MLCNNLTSDNNNEYGINRSMYTNKSYNDADSTNNPWVRCVSNIGDIVCLQSIEHCQDQKPPTRGGWGSTTLT